MGTIQIAVDHKVAVDQHEDSYGFGFNRDWTGYQTFTLKVAWACGTADFSEIR